MSGTISCSHVSDRNGRDMRTDVESVKEEKETGRNAIDAWRLLLFAPTIIHETEGMGLLGILDVDSDSAEHVNDPEAEKVSGNVRVYIAGGGAYAIARDAGIPITGTLTSDRSVE